MHYISVFGCAGESDRGKRSMMTKIATDKSEVVFLTSDNPKTEHPCICSRLFLSAFKSGSSLLEHVLALR